MTTVLEHKLSLFREVFDDEEHCISILADQKWKDGYQCVKCGGTNYCKGKSFLSRRCTRCKKEESVTANTAFHRCKIPITKAFEIAFTICNVPEVSSYEISRRIDIRHMTCYSFQKKILNCREDGEGDKILESVLKILNKEVESRMSLS